MDLRIRIDPRLKEPIYRQLYEAIAQQIFDGDLPDGSQLPSVRELALELRINPNTVARAYREAEIAGIVVSQRGRGVFVSYPKATVDQEIPPKVSTALDRLLTAALDSHTPLETVLAELEKRARSRKEEF